MIRTKVPAASPVIRDKRRIDPETGEVREAAAAAAASATETAGCRGASLPHRSRVIFSALEAELAERTADVQRVHAEYANYRKRVDRDREQVRDHATAAVLAELLTVLDDIDRARDHDELAGGFKSVAEPSRRRSPSWVWRSTEAPVSPFDPTVHEALMHSEDASVTETTCVTVFQPGYRFADRVLRPARVAVADPPT